MTASFVNSVFSSLTILAQVVSVVVVGLIISRRFPAYFFARNGVFFAFLVALVAMLGSLTYSNILGYEPCTLCWVQRIFMYPLVFILGLSLFKGRNTHVADYSLLLSTLGAIIAGYHYLLQTGWLPSVVCNAVGASETCARMFVMHYGYITIPMMAFAAFVLIIVLLVAYKKGSKRLAEQAVQQ